MRPVEPAPGRCGDCAHRSANRADLEALIPGLASLGSGFGASVAESRLCMLHDRLVSPNDACGRFSRA
ncbi:hypothetical protein D7S86_00490 [Pararobbsia silviterrae]|uniref:Uncharacterized protein n=1 Tax=Pararobbsia silviterrae TaxID=1792498 RepID=A0A494Y9M0_9BURK|nr:hypothetical protein D7S86_00490 [Pararobbsia silviterrae]